MTSERFSFSQHHSSLWHTPGVSRSRINRQDIIISITWEEEEEGKSSGEQTSGTERAGPGQLQLRAVPGRGRARSGTRAVPGSSRTSARCPAIYRNKELFRQRDPFLGLSYQFIFPSNLIYYTNVIFYFFIKLLDFATPKTPQQWIFICHCAWRIFQNFS